MVKIDSLATFSPEKCCRVPIENAKGLIRLLCFEPGQGVPAHTHPKSDEFFFVIEGKGRITIEKEGAKMQNQGASSEYLQGLRIDGTTARIG